MNTLPNNVEVRPSNDSRVHDLVGTSNREGRGVAEADTYWTPFYYFIHIHRYPKFDLWISIIRISDIHKLAE